MPCHSEREDGGKVIISRVTAPYKNNHRTASEMGALMPQSISRRNSASENCATTTTTCDHKTHDDGHDTIDGSDRENSFVEYLANLFGDDDNVWPDDDDEEGDRTSAGAKCCCRIYNAPPSLLGKIEYCSRAVKAETSDTQTIRCGPLEMDIREISREEVGEIAKEWLSASDKRGRHLKKALQMKHDIFCVVEKRD